MSLRFKKITPPTFEFVTVSNPNQTKSSETVRAIRRQAGRSGARKAKKPSYRTIHVFEAEADDEQSLREEPLVEASPKQELHAIYRSLGAGLGLNPFQSFPITHDANTTRLLQFLLDDATKAYRPMHAIWMSVALTDPGAFYLMLANAATAMSERQGQEDIESTRYYTLSLSLLNKRMNDPQHTVCEGMMAAILGFACLDVCLTSA